MGSVDHGHGGYQGSRHHRRDAGTWCGDPIDEAELVEISMHVPGMPVAGRTRPCEPISSLPASRSALSSPCTAAAAPAGRRIRRTAERTAGAAAVEAAEGAAAGGAEAGAAAASGGGSGGGSGSSSGATGGSVTFSIDVTKGPARQFQPPANPVARLARTSTASTLSRRGSDRPSGACCAGAATRITDWNWTNNFTNSALRLLLLAGQRGRRQRRSRGRSITGTPSVPVGAERAASASLVTVPIVDYVASSAVTNNVWSGSNPPCPGTPSCTAARNGYAVKRRQPRLRLDRPRAAPPSSPTTRPRAAPSARATGSGSGCAVNTTGPVYQDEFVNYMKVTYGSGAAPIFFMLDNEPNYWPSTHPELWPHTGTPGCGTSGTVTFDDIVTRNTTYATAIKTAWPHDEDRSAPSSRRTASSTRGDYSDPNLPTPFADYYLGKMAAASATAGHAALDVFDVHYYTSNGSDLAVRAGPAHVLGPELHGLHRVADRQHRLRLVGAEQLLRHAPLPAADDPAAARARSRRRTRARAPPRRASRSASTTPGCETSIEGGVAEADLLGIFGREGVFAATAWPLQTVTTSGALVNYLVAAYDLVPELRRQGRGRRRHGRLRARRPTSRAPRSTPSRTRATPAAVDVVAINKTSAAITVTVDIAHAPSLTTATPISS